MEKANNYKQLVKSILLGLANREGTYSFPITHHIVFDDKRGHYLLFHDGWKGHQRMYMNMAHISVTDEGHVWLQYDGTDLVIGQMLLDRGVEKSDLVVGFHPPDRRKDTEYAVS